MLSISLAMLILGAPAAEAVDKASDERVYVGKLMEASRDELELELSGSDLMIGFFGDPKVLDTIGQVHVGDQVRAVFGVGKRPGETRKINKLLSIRRCATVDLECESDRKKQELEEAREAKRREESQKKQSACYDEMDAILRKDVRYVPKVSIGNEEAARTLVAVNALEGSSKACAAEVIQNHQTAVLEACEIQHSGDTIGGGCYHIAGYSMTDAVLKRAVAECKAK
jgi:hypothetical protein